MIPKTIHYCWFGGKEMPAQLKKYIKSWKKYCPDYEIKLWNEENFDINSNQYVKEAYENKKYAFVTDYVRLFALYNYGGIYMDTDVELVKPLDELLAHKAFSGFEGIGYVTTGILASEKENPLFKVLLNYYADKHFINKDGTFDMTTNVQTITGILSKMGLNKNNKYQELENITLYPSDYFCPIDWKTKEKNITSNTYAIHWFAGSWVPKKTFIQKTKERIKKYLVSLFGEEKTVLIIKKLKGGK